MSDTPRRGDQREVVIDDLAKGGAGVGRLVGGRVVFVPGTFPGDRAKVQLGRVKKRFANASLEAILEPSPQRVEPPCERAGVCGGCPWMALSYDAQLAAKGRIVAETLARLGGVERARVEATRPSPVELGYRSRARLHGRDGRLGFFGVSGRRVVDVPSCPVLAPELEALLPRLREQLLGLGGGRFQVEMALEAGGRARVAVSGAGVGEVVLPGAELTVYDQPLGDHPPRRLAFAQANSGVNAMMVETVTAFLGPVPGLHFVDVFCGSGNFSIPLIEAGASVLGLEGRSDAIDAARLRAPSPHNARFVVADAARLGEYLQAGDTVDGAVINPPRGGAAMALGALMEAAPARLVYVSCDPATLARDLKTLGALYELEVAIPFDMMPHTAHVEVVALLRLRKKGG